MWLKLKKRCLRRLLCTHVKATGRRMATFAKLCENIFDAAFLSALDLVRLFASSPWFCSSFPSRIRALHLTARSAVGWQWQPIPEAYVVAEHFRPAAYFKRLSHLELLEVDINDGRQEFESADATAFYARTTGALISALEAGSWPRLRELRVGVCALAQGKEVGPPTIHQVFFPHADEEMPFQYHSWMLGIGMGLCRAISSGSCPQLRRIDICDSLGLCFFSNIRRYAWERVVLDPHATLIRETLARLTGSVVQDGSDGET